MYVLSLIRYNTQCNIFMAVINYIINFVKRRSRGGNYTDYLVINM